MDDQRKNHKRKRIKTLIKAVKMYSHDVGMEFGKEKCSLLVMKSRKRCMTEGMELLNQEKIRTLIEKETYKY